MPLRRIAGSAPDAEHWCLPWLKHWNHAQVMVLLAATDTAAIPGISAAGATAASRRATAAADAELLLLGPERPRPHALPPLPAGVSPALISHVVLQELGLSPLLVDLGCPVAPAVAHLRLPLRWGGGPARCLSRGQAMDPGRVKALMAVGHRWGSALARGRVHRPLVLTECVPGGTSTAQAVLTALGLEVEGLVSGSLREPAHRRKAALVERGMAASDLVAPVEPRRALAALGDPMQALAASLLLALAGSGVPVLLAGGSQMAAVLALALALAPPPLRQHLAADVAIGTTAWVAAEPSSDLSLLLERIGARWQVAPLAFAADLRFDADLHKALADYERGFVKEGVGAGGLALLWQLSGRSPEVLARRCDRACRQLLADDLRSAHG